MQQRSKTTRSRLVTLPPLRILSLSKREARLKRLAVVFCLFVSLSGFAQQDRKRSELGLTLGAELIPTRSTANQTLDFANSIVFGANYARHLSKRHADTTKAQSNAAPIRYSGQ